jgi:glyoxalase family protein
VGQIAITSFSVPAGSLGDWQRRLEPHGLTVGDAPTRFGQESLLVNDPSGLQIELVASGVDARTPWRGGDVDGDMAIRGLHSVTMFVRDAAPTIDFMRGTLGFDLAQVQGVCHRLTVNGNVPGKIIDVIETGDAAGVNGLGTVHHVAMAIADPDEQVRLRDELLGRGIHVTPLMDRQYFHSIYFREPGGVLFEVATTQPGFAVDEPVAELGRSLKLPPWEEPNRAAIEAVLPPVRY